WAWHEDQAARRVARRMIERLDELISPDGDWSADALAADGGIDPPGATVRHDPYFPSTAGRLIGSLVKYAAASGEERPLALARRIARHALATCFDPAGAAIEEKTGWHVHSVTSTISSLAELARADGDRELLERTEQLYKAAFGRLITRIGWSKENLSNNLDIGEINNTGDIIQTALILSSTGVGDYYSDVWRMMHAHFLPAQLTDTSWVNVVETPASDAERDIRGRVLGAFGFPAPYGHKSQLVDYLNFNFDITCGALQALCEVQRHVVQSHNGACNVMLPFACADGKLALGPLGDEQSGWRVEISEPLSVALRLPDWAAPETIRVQSAGRDLAPVIRDRALLIQHTDGRPGGYDILIPDAEYETDERIMDVDYRVLWRGDQIVSMTAGETAIPFFETPGHSAICK
ncbi:MAG TPA: hypothetical protein PLG73_15275, partial [Candidatus Sumerlaeota bacterium]|nr:hypothetical protein [Candidatus Sumerlaeota bacterium]